MGDVKKLILVHVIFRHGNRTPDAGFYFPKQTQIDLEQYKPYGLGQLTDEGKSKMLNLGGKLRERYKSFLGEYNSEFVEASSSNVGRTKASLNLVLNGIYPSEKSEEFLIHYLPLKEDNVSCTGDFGYESKPKIFLPSISNVYKTTFGENFKKSKIGQKILHEHKTLIDYLHEHTGMETETTHGVYRVYDLLNTQKSLNVKLPSWVESIDWEEFQSLVSKHYSTMMVETKELKNYLGGRMLEKIISDTREKIESNENNRRIYLYSGHDINVAGILGILNLSYDHIPQYGACVILEVYEKGSNCEIQIFHSEEPDKEFEMKMEISSLKELEMLIDRNYLL